ncbi:hypothetical protein OC846_006162, partial [Tilletia horrida]
LPDISGLTSALGTPARTLNRSRHVRVEQGFPQPRKRGAADGGKGVAQLPNADSLAVALDLRARVESGDDSDDGSASAESESVHHFPSTQCPNQVPDGHEVSNKSATAASDSHPRLFLEGNRHPRAQHAREAEAASHAFGLEWQGSRPPLSAYAMEQRKLSVEQLAKSNNTHANTVPNTSAPAPGETTTKLEHMHAELAKIVDRLGRLENDPQSSQPRASPAANALSDNEAVKNREPALSRGAIRDMQAHMRELMRELQLQRKALSAIAQLEQDSVVDDVLVKDNIRQQLALHSPWRAATNHREGQHNGESEPHQRPLRWERRRLPSPSIADRQKQLCELVLEEDGSLPQKQAMLTAKDTTNRWTGDADALHAQMERVLHHVNLLRDEVEGGVRASGGDDLAGKPTAINSKARLNLQRPLETVSEPVSPFLQPTNAKVKRTARSSDPPVTTVSPATLAGDKIRVDGTRPRSAETEPDEGAELSQEIENRAASAFARVRQYARHDRERAPSPSPTANWPHIEGHSNSGTAHAPCDSVPDLRPGAVSPTEHYPRSRKATKHDVDLLHDERDCTVCHGAHKTEKRRAARRDRVRADERDKRSRRRQAGGTEEEELLIDVLVEEAERYNRANASAALDGPTSERTHLKNLVQLTAAQRAVLNRMVKQHMDEFIHQRMLFSELADELKRIHPDMSATRRKILSEHVMEAVETLEVKAERINALQRLLGYEVGGGEDGLSEEARRGPSRRSAALRGNTNEAGPYRTSLGTTTSKANAAPELASDYSDGEGQQEENVFLSAAAAAAQARRGRNSPRLDEPPPLEADEPMRSGSTTSSGKAGHRPDSWRPSSRSRAFSRGRLPTSYSPPTTLAAQELAVDLDVDEREGDGRLGSGKFFDLDNSRVSPMMRPAARPSRGLSSPVRGAGSPFGVGKYR